MLKRQLHSDEYYFRVIGELRYLLGALVQHVDREEGKVEFAHRSQCSLLDPSMIDKVIAQRLLKELYAEFLQKWEMVPWLYEIFSEMDPDDPQWMVLKNWDKIKHQAGAGEPPRPGSISASLMFLELCHECDNHEKTIDTLMEALGPAMVAMALQSPPVPPPVGEARQRHAERLENDPDYRQEVESAMNGLVQLVGTSPEMGRVLRESFKRTRIFGLSRDSEAMEDFAVVQEEVDAMLHALETKEINTKH